MPHLPPEPKGQRVTADTAPTVDIIKPPADPVLAAERALVGAMLSSTIATDTAAGIITATDFYNPELITVAQACFDLSGAGKPVDHVTVHHHLASTRQLALLKRSGPALLADLISEACLPHPGAVAYHADIVAHDALRRRMHTACASMRQFTEGPDFEPEHVQIVLDTIQNASNPTVNAAHTSDAVWVGDDLDEFFTDLTVQNGDDRIPTPWADLNEKVALRGGQLVVIGGRPGDGKSLAGLGIAAFASIHHGYGALVASLEMRRWELMRRLVAAEAKVELGHLEGKSVTEYDWERIRTIEKQVRAAPLAIESSGNVSIAHLRSRLRHLSKHTPIRVLVVDYLQLLQVTKKAERRDLDIAEFTRELKQIAVDNDVCVIALSQLNRGMTGRAEKRPQMSDLRESGAIEADADTVILLHRAAEGEEGPLAGEVEMIIPKQRAGASNIVVRLAFQGHYARLFNMRRD